MFLVKPLYCSAASTTLQESADSLTREEPDFPLLPPKFRWCNQFYIADSQLGYRLHLPKEEIVQNQMNLLGGISKAEGNTKNTSVTIEIKASSYFAYLSRRTIIPSQTYIS